MPERGDSVASGVVAKARGATAMQAPAPVPGPRIAAPREVGQGAGFPMRKVFILIAAAGVLAGGSAGAVDVTDREAVLAAYNAQSGWQATADDLCIVTDPAFPDVAVVGTLAHDRGCAVELVLVEDSWLPPTAASSPALLARGWQDLDAEARAALAMAWMRFAIFPFHTVIEEPGEDFAAADAPEFVAPAAVADDAGGAVVTAWVREPSGMLPESVYRLWELTFDAGGKQVRTRVLADWQVAW